MSKKEFEKLVLEELSKLNGRFDNLEWRFDNLEWRFDNLEWRFDNLEWKVDNLEKEMNKRFEEFDNKMEAWFDRLENLINTETTELSEKIDNQEKYLTQAFQIITRLQNEKEQNLRRYHMI